LFIIADYSWRFQVGPEAPAVRRLAEELSVGGVLQSRYDGGL